MESIKQFTRFVVQQALSCIFPVAVFGALAVSRYIHIPLISRYDLLLIVCVAVQWLMLVFKLESKDELKVICVFHILGLMLEIFKVHRGSWAYPEHGVSMVMGVPLYSGFMYASVASYICQAWKRFDLKLIHWPRNLPAFLIACLIYLNFFTHHFLPDLRWWIVLISFIVFGKSRVLFHIDGAVYRMRVVLSFLLIGFFIWLAENIATFLGAWRYPNQLHVWRMVHLGKISSWYLLIIISIIIIANLKRLKYGSSSMADAS